MAVWSVLALRLWLMDLSSGLPTLLKLDAYCLREICAFLATGDILNLWSTNDFRLHALLRRCDAFGFLQISLKHPYDLARAYSWKKTLENPRIKLLTLDLKTVSHPLLFRRFVMSCGVQTVDCNSHDLGSLLKSLKKWRELSTLDDHDASTIMATTSFKFDLSNSPNAKALALLPSTLTELEIPAQSAPSLPTLNRLTSLTLTASTLTLDRDLRGTPFIWSAGRSSLSCLTKLDIKMSYEADTLPIFELPINLTHLKFSYMHPASHAPIFIWPKHTLQKLEWKLKIIPPKPSILGFAQLARCLNCFTLQHFCPELTHFRAPPPEESDFICSADVWNGLAGYVGQTIFDQLVPPGCTPKSIVHASDQGNARDRHFFASIIDNLPHDLTSLDMVCKTSQDLHAVLVALRLYPLRQLSTLRLFIYATEDKDLLPLPSSITKLKLSGSFKVTSAFVNAVLPPSLTRFDATFAHADALLALREKFGQSLQIVCCNDTLGLPVAFPTIMLSTLSHERHTSGKNHGALTELHTDSFKVDAQLSTQSHSPSERIGPYGPYDRCDANGRWTITYSGLRNALARFFGQRTKAIFSFAADSDWPSSVTNVSLNDQVTKMSHTGHGALGIDLRHIGSRGFFKHASSVTFGPETQFQGSRKTGSPKWTSLDLATDILSLPTLPSALTRLRSSTQASNTNWPAFIESLPNLTELWLPNMDCPLEALKLPIGLRHVLLKIRPAILDSGLRECLQPLSSLELAEFHASGVVFTAPNWPSLTLNLSDLDTWIEAYLKPHVDAKVTIKSIKEIKVAVDLLPEALTSLNLIGCSQRFGQCDLPNLTHYSDVFLSCDPPPLDTLPELQEFRGHFNSLGNFLPSLPSRLRSLCVTTSSDIFAIMTPKDQEGCFVISVPILPCAAYLHTLAVPGIFLNTFTARMQVLTPEGSLQNLTRLIISGQHCSDADIHHILQSNFPKLKRLTLTGYVRFTGQLLTESSSSPVSFESLFRDTRTTLLRVLESKERKSMNALRSSDPSLLERDEKSSQPSLPLAATALPRTDPSSTDQSLTDSLKPEVIVALYLPEVSAPTPPTTFLIPSDSTHVSLLPDRGEPWIYRIVPIEYSQLDMPAIDKIEIEARKQIEVLPPWASGSFTWSWISNWSDLSHLVDVEYDSKAWYTPGDFFQYSTLQRLKIHAPIAAVSSSTTLRYAQWILPASLAHLIVTKAMRSFDFVSADGEQVSQLSTLELPHAIWQAEDAVPPNLSKLVIMDCKPRTIAEGLESRGCEIVFN